MSRHPDLEFDDAAVEWIARHVAEADAVNEEIGVAGPDVAAYNLREAWLRLAERRLLDANVLCRRLEREHEAHPVTQKIRAWQKTQHKGGSKSS